MIRKKKEMRAKQCANRLSKLKNERDLRNLQKRALVSALKQRRARFGQ